MSELRALITRALLDGGGYIDDARFDRVRLEAAGAAGQHLRPALQRVCGEGCRGRLGRTLAGAIARMFGHGWQQAAGFAALAGVARTAWRMSLGWEPC